MGANNGTGCPNWLRCWSCRRGRGILAHGGRLGLEATGRTKPLRTHHIGIRSTNRQIEYRCRECGFVGWSKHIDAEQLFARLKKKG